MTSRAASCEAVSYTHLDVYKRQINTFITKESSLPELIRSMVGREVSWEKKKHSNVAADAPVLLEVQGLSLIHI